MITYSPAGVQGLEGHGVDGFFSEVCDRGGRGRGAPACAPDPEVFTRRMDAYGVDMVGPPPTL